MKALKSIQSLLKVAALALLFATPTLAQAFQIAELPTACLPDRAVKDQTQACHCPPARLCDDPEAMPFDLQLRCCDVPTGACKNNGCTSGWQQAYGTQSGMPLFYCKTKPDCSKIFAHIPTGYNISDAGTRTAIKKSAPAVVNIKSSITESSDVWVCQISGNCGVESPLYDVSAWNLIGSALGGYDKVCVYPTKCGTGVCGETVGLDNVVFARNCGMDCLPKNIKVLMADGTQKSIHEIKVGDKVKTQTATNEVLEISISKSGEKKMNSINDGKFIITDGHPVLTQKGWAALGMATSKDNANTKNWSGRELRIGDMLIGEKGAFKVEKITPVKAEDGESYNLKLSGDNTFIANGVMVQGFNSANIEYNKAKKVTK